MHFAVAGNSTFAEQIASGFLEAGLTCDFAISRRPDRLPTGTSGLSAWAEARGIDFFETADINAQSTHSFLSGNRYSPQLLLVSWPQILGAETRAHFPLGVIGSHPTPIPWGRGRHPLHWQISMGLEQAALTFFLLDDGVDTGPVLMQEELLLPKGIRLEETIDALDDLGFQMALRLGRFLAYNQTLPIPVTRVDEGSKWRSRDEHDITIDFRMSLDAITRLVRSFSEPFPGARIVAPDSDLRVKTVQDVSSDHKNWKNFSIGSILRTTPSSLDVRVDDGVGQFEIRSTVGPRPTPGQQLRTPAAAEHFRHLQATLSADSRGSQRRVAVIGWEEGLAGQVSTWIESELGYQVALFIHPDDRFEAIDPTSALDRPATKFSFPANGTYLERPFHSGSDWTEAVKKSGISEVVCCLSDSTKRLKAYNDGLRAGLSFPPIIHPSAQVLAEVDIEAGVIIEPQCYVGYRAELKACVNLHAGSQVDHHSVIEAGATLLPGSVVAGNCLVSTSSIVGMGALISNRVQIGPHTFVGAGSTVLESFPIGGEVLVGTPARSLE